MMTIVSMIVELIKACGDKIGTITIVHIVILPPMQFLNILMTLNYSTNKVPYSSNKIVAQ